MLVVLIPEDATTPDDAYALLTVQPRLATGTLDFVELPAGMLDDSGNFGGTAAREIEEELGLVIAPDQLTCLTDRARAMRRSQDKDNAGELLPFAMYPSAGGCDEHIKLYLHERREPRATRAAWEGKLTGLRAEGELITLRVVPLEELWLAGGRDAKALAAYLLYTKVKAWEREQTAAGLMKE